MSFFSSCSTCLRWGLPSEVCHRQPLIYGKLTQALLHWQYWLKKHWPKRPFKHWVNPSLDGWQRQLSLSNDRGTHRSRHSKSMDTDTSLNHSDIFILMIGTYFSLFKCLVWLTTQRILGFFDRPCPVPSRPGTRQITKAHAHRLLLVDAARVVSSGGLKARCYDGAERLLLRMVVETRMWIGKQDMQSCKTAKKHTDLFSNSAILSNNCVSLLSDL